MKRGEPLKRTTGLKRTGSVNAVSSKRRKRDAGYGAAREQVFERARGLCEANVAADCTRRCEQVHHKRGRGGDDPHSLTNLLGVCLPCHEWIERHRDAAYRLGLLVRRNAVERPGTGENP